MTMRAPNPVDAARAAATMRSSAIVLPRAHWTRRQDGAVAPQAGTWYAAVTPGKHPLVAPIIGCPACGKGCVVPTSEAVRALKLQGFTIFHTIDHVGRVRPDFTCVNDPCTFRRPVILGRWKDAKPVWCVLYTQGRSLDLHEMHCYAANRVEAIAACIRPGRVLVEAAPAVGWKQGQGGKEGVEA